MNSGVGQLTMFDVFDILLPEISTTRRLEVRQQETAFGLKADRFAYVDGSRFGKVLAADAAYSDIKSWSGSSSRANWTVLLAAGTANTAAANDETWAQFLNALALVLSAHAVWRVKCESDCDQHPVEKLEISADKVCMLLDGHRRSGLRPISFHATSIEPS